MALRNEEEALLRYQNATRKREHNIDQLKYRPNLVDYTSVTAKKAVSGKKSAVRAPAPNTLEPLEVNLDQIHGQRSVKRQGSVKES